MQKTILDEIFNAVEIDERIDTGIFDVSQPQHIDVFIEHAISHGLSEQFAINCANLLTEGKYPERQAYNVNGLLVTFPTPEYKQRALANGTHFEHNPKNAQVNIFGGDAASPQQAPQQSTTSASQAPQQAPAPQPAPPQPEPPATGSMNLNNRTPAEVAQDAQIVKTMMMELTLNEAIQKNNIFEGATLWFNGIQLHEFYLKRNEGAEMIKIRVT